MTRELQNIAHADHSGMCRNDDIGIDCSELQQKSSQLELNRGTLMSRHFGTSYHPNDHYMRGPGPACAQNARNILKTNARPASPVQAPARDAGPPFILSHAEFLADITSSQALKNLVTTAFSFFVLGLAALPFFLGAVIWSLFF
jgi:hypothetical protein